MRKNIILLIVPFMLMLSCSSSEKSSEDSAMDDKEMEEVFSNSEAVELFETINANEGEEFNIEFFAAPVAGKTWVVREPLDEKLQFIDHKFIPEVKNPDVSANNGTMTFRFKALKKGFASITLMLIDSRKKGVKPGKCIVYNININ